MEATGIELLLIQKLKEEGVLVNVQHERLPLSEGIIVVNCGDGDQFCDRFQYLQEMLKIAGAKVRPHTLTRHGGALRLVADSPLNKQGRTTDLDLIDEIAEAMDLKKIYTIIVEAHYPCGKCKYHGISLPEALSLLVRAKERVLQEFNNVQVAGLFHVDHGGDKKRYYKFNRHAWGSLHPYTRLRLSHPTRTTQLVVPERI